MITSDSYRQYFCALKKGLDIAEEEYWAVSYLRTCRPPSLKSVPYQKVIVNDAECYEYNGKNNKKILRFLFFELSSKIGVIFSEKLH